MNMEQLKGMKFPQKIESSLGIPQYPQETEFHTNNRSVSAKQKNYFSSKFGTEVWPISCPSVLKVTNSWEIHDFPTFFTFLPFR